MTRINLALALAATLVVAGCPGEPDPPPAPPPKDTPKAGRAETRNIRNLEIIGVSGAPVADKVDGALQANEDRKKELEAQEANSE